MKQHLMVPVIARNALVLLIGAVLGAIVAPPIIDLLYMEKDVATLDIDRATESSITAYNRRGQTLWVHPLWNQITTLVWRDIDLDGNSEVLVGVGHAGRNPGSVYMFETNGVERWRVATGSTEAYGFTDTYSVEDVLVEDLDGDGENEIIVNSHEYRWYPARVLVLTIRGEIIGEYWHPGYIYALKVVDIDGDGTKEIVCGGTNKSDVFESSPVLFVLSPSDVAGQAPPCYGDVPAGSHLHYIVLPKSTLDEYSDSSEVAEITLEGNLLVASVSDGRFYSFLLPNLEPHSISFSDGYHFRLESLTEAANLQELGAIGSVEIIDSCGR